MKVSVFGLGYVGSVSAACLADQGHHVTGVDTSETKVALMGAGKAPIVEPELADMTRRAVARKLMAATTDAEDALMRTEISLLCVGTPSRGNGSLNLDYLEGACAEIGHVLRKKNAYHVVAVRSTVLPGTMRGMVIPVLEKSSGRRAGVDFGVCNNPEFLREGTAVHDFRHPPKTVIGETDARSGDMVQSLYDGLPGPVIRCQVEIGEMVKYADNAWHAVKVAFANEIGTFCKAASIDSHRVMEIFCQDTKLNISTCYLRPGFAFGGSCLPKDVRALTYKARSLDVSTPLLDSLIPSNRAQIEAGMELILHAGSRKVGIFGFSFKQGTDDLRESPLVDVIERLVGKGFDLRLYDRNVNIARLVGANRDYILKAIPHIERLMMPDMASVLAHADIVVIGNNAAEFRNIAGRLRPDQTVIDFVRISAIEESHEKYQGICW
jgi:GDP-mannose 6-dehydrogenase